MVTPEPSRAVTHFLVLMEADKTKPAIGDTKIPLLQRKESATDS
jgi:hypothetical protein